MMPVQPGPGADPERPEFMIKLGLLPPYTVEDVHEAYREKAKTAHPDRGGSAADFRELKEAYDCAQEYMKFRQNRGQWMAANVERYAQQEAVVNEVRRRGGQVEIETNNWLKKSFGEFAVVTEMLRGIRLRDQADGDAFLKFLGEHSEGLAFLQRLDLAGSHIGDQSLLGLGFLKSLRTLDVSRTRITRAGLAVVASVPTLEWLNVGGTSVSWWARWRWRRAFPRLRVVAVAT